MGHKSLKDIANPSQLGDPVSLKAETSDHNPTDNDKGAANDSKPSLKESAEQSLKNNPSALGDPISLKAETSDTVPTDNDRGALGDSTKDAAREAKSKL